MERKMKRTLLFVVVSRLVVGLLFTAPVLFAQEAGQAAKTGQSREGTPDSSITSRVDKFFEKWDKPDSPGCALGIVKDGQLIYKRGYGMANLDYNIPISPKSVFDIASISKQFTAMSILLLAKQGKLSLDDEIQKYLPELPRYQSPITIRHLVHHTSGIRDYYDLFIFAGMFYTDVHLTDDDFLGLIARQKELNFKPGEEYLYNNSGYFLQGLIVKRVSGKSLREFAEENIFKPLGMNNTYFHDDRTSVVRNRVTGYEARRNGGFAVDIQNNESVGDGNLFTSVEDLFLWDQNFYNNKLGGGADLIREQLSTGMLNNGEKTTYAFGLQVEEYKGLKRVRHGGGGSGFRTLMIRFPEQNFSVICLCNETGIGVPGLANQVADIFLADQLKKVQEPVKEIVAPAPDIISIPEKELASLAGTYLDPIKETTVLFYLKDGKLMIFNAALSPLSQNRFKVVGGGPLGLEIVFVRPIAGGHMQAMFKHRSGETTTYDAVQNVTPTSVQLAEFAGKYVSDELPGATYTLSIKDGKLVLQVRSGITVFSDRALVLEDAPENRSKDPKDNLLTPAFADAFFVFESALLRFTRNRQNAVSGFTLTRRGGVRRLRFNKQ